MKTLKDYLNEKETGTNSDVGVSLSEDSNVPPATQDYMTKVIAKKIKPGLDPDGEEFEDQAYLYHTSELGRRDLMAKGGNWRAYYDAIKWHYKNMNESVKEGLEDVKPKSEENRQILNMLRVFFDDREGYQDAVAIDAVEYLNSKGLLKDFINTLPYFDEDYEEFLDSYPKDWLEKRFGITEDSVNEGYKGWTYSSHEEDYDDVVKLSHVATKDGKEVSMDWSPYNKPTDEEFKLWVDLGMPTRKAVNGIGPLNKDDLLQLAKTKKGTHSLLQREDKELNEMKRLSGLSINEDKKEDPLASLVDPKTKLDIMKAQVKNRGQSKGDPLAALAIELAKNVERLDKENDIEDAQIAAQDVVDKMHTDAINKLKKKPATVQEAFQYHIDNNIPIRENVFRPGSDSYFELFNYARQQVKEGNYTPDWEDQELLETEIGQVVKLANGYRVPLDQPFADDKLSEAEYQGKKVELNKPKRGGPKKFYVYVKNPKTGKVKKVTWGDTSGLSVKASKPGRVASFVARHNCKQKNDKTKAGYWACRTPRYKSLGVKGGQWW